MNGSLVQSVASLLALSEADLGDERDCIRTLQAAGIDNIDVVMLIESATESARVIRANSSEFEVS